MAKIINYGWDANNDPFATTVDEITEYYNVDSTGFGGSYLAVTTTSLNYPISTKNRLFVNLPHAIDVANNSSNVIIVDTTINTTLSVVSTLPTGNEYRLPNAASVRKNIIEISSTKVGNSIDYSFKSQGSMFTAYEYNKMGLKDSERGIYGFSLTRSSTDTNHMIIGTGQALDSTFQEYLFSETILTKRLNSVWAAGNNAGGLDSGSIAADTTYHVYVIRKNIDNTIDFIFSTNMTSPAMPTGYTYYRRIGTFQTNSTPNIRNGYFVRTSPSSLRFFYDTPTVDYSGGLSTASNFTVGVPLGIECLATVRIYASSSDSAGYMQETINHPTKQTTTSADVGSVLAMYTAGAGFAGSIGASEILINTSTSSQIRHANPGSVGFDIFIGIIQWEIFNL